MNTPEQPVLSAETSCRRLGIHADHASLAQDGIVGNAGDPAVPCWP